MNYESPEVHNMFHYASSSSIMIIGLNAQFCQLLAQAEGQLFSHITG